MGDQGALDRPEGFFVRFWKWAWPSALHVVRGYAGGTDPPELSTEHRSRGRGLVDRVRGRVEMEGLRTGMCRWVSG